MLGYSWSSAWAWLMNPSSPLSTLPIIKLLCFLHTPTHSTFLLCCFFCLGMYSCSPTQQLSDLCPLI